MPNDEYLDYLDSPEWWSMRKLAMQRADYQCERCHATQWLNVHHRTYRRIGAEYVNDLQVLCETCHREEHALRNRQKRMFELCGQARLFDRWDNPDGGCTPALLQ